jgi:manganese/zinc/iron transport system permease protein
MTDLIQMAVLGFVAISCGLIGPFLVLKRMTMFANSLSHTVLLGIAVAFLITGGSFFNFSNLILGAFFASVITAFLTEGLSRFFHLQEDASIGLVFSSLFALGIAIVTIYMRDVHLGVEAVMGNADILQMSDVWSSGLVTLFVLMIVTCFYRPLKLVCFDQNFARALGIRKNIYHFLLLNLASVVCVAAFRSVGVLLVLAFLTGPFFIARMLSHRLGSLLVITPFIGVCSAFGGVALSRFIFEFFGLPLSTGGITVMLIGLLYVVTSWIRKKSQSSVAQAL